MANEEKITSIVDLAAIKTEIDTVKKYIDELVASMAKVAGGISGAGGKLNDSQTIKDATAAQKELTAQKEKAINITGELSTKQKEQIELQLKLSQAKKAYKDQLAAEVSAYSKLSQEYGNALQKAKDLGAQYGVQSKQAKEAAAQTVVLNNKLKEIDSSLGNHQRNVGNYSSGLDGVKAGWTKVLGVLGLATAAFGLVTGAVEIYKKMAATSEVATDKFKEVMKGIDFATTQFWRTLQSGDFSNLLTGMKEAYDIGKEYEAMLDLVAHRNTAIDLEYQKQKAHVAELYEKIRTGVDLETGQVLTLDQKITLSKELAEIQKMYYNEKIENAKIENDGELQKITNLINIGQVQKKTTEEVKKDLDLYTSRDASDIKLRKNAEIINDLYADKKAALKEINLNIQTNKGYVTDADKAARTGLTEEIKLIELRTDKTSQYAKLLRLYEGTIGAEQVNAYLKSIGKKSDADAAYDQEQKRLKGSQAKLIKEEQDKETKAYETYLKNLDTLTKTHRDETTSLLKDGIEKDKEVLKNKYDDELKALAAMHLSKKEYLIREAEITEIYDAKVVAITEKYNGQKAEADAKYLENALANAETLLKAQSEAYSKDITEFQSAIELKYAGLKDKSGKEQELLDLSIAANQNRYDQGIIDEQTYQTELNKLKAQQLELDKSNADKQIELEKEVNEQKLELTKTAYETLKSITGSYFEKQLMNIDEESQADSDAKEKELSNKTLTDAQKEAINKKYNDKEKEREKERKKVAHDKAVADKAFGALSIIINTAVAAIKAYADLGPIAGAISSALIIGEGALELSAVLAEPIPAYAKGRKGGKAELAEVGEQGFEGIIHNGLLSLTPNKATKMFLPEGADVIPHDKMVKALYENPNLSGSFGENVNTSQVIADAVIASNNGVIKAIQNKKELNIKGSIERGIEYEVKNGNAYIKYIDKKLRN